MHITKPAASTSQATCDGRRELKFVPLESELDTAHYWLIATTTFWYEDGYEHSRVELGVRCRHCNWGWDGHLNTPVDDLILLGTRATEHVHKCKHDGRTIPYESPVVIPSN